MDSAGGLRRSGVDAGCRSAGDLQRLSRGLYQLAEACFKYRNKIGLDTCLEALQTFRQQRGFNADVILKYATICRVAKVMRPYIEAIL